jgi:hypothetical protein
MTKDLRMVFHRPWCLQKKADPLLFKHGDPVLYKPEVIKKMIDASNPCACRNVSSDMPFIRLSWLLNLDTDLVDIPPMQKLPKEAFISENKMEQAYFVSHRWLDETHPDRSGRQLAVAISQMWSDGNLTHPHESPNQWNEAHKIGIWYDYLCLPQHPRSPEEQSLFDKLLPEIAALTLCTMPILVVDGDMEYSTRAWCVAEAAGVYFNGFNPNAVGIWPQVYRYRNIIKKVIIKNKRNWSLPRKERGYSAGLAKLLQWIRLTNDPKLFPLFENLDYPRLINKHVKAGSELGKRVMLILEKAIHMSCSNSAEWIVLAHQNDLHCRRKEDLKYCMEIIRKVVHRNFDI